MVGTIPAVNINSIANISIVEIDRVFIFINKKLLSVPVKRHKLSLPKSAFFKNHLRKMGGVLICVGAPV